jgi:hypothetical protein
MGADAEMGRRANQNGAIRMKTIPIPEATVQQTVCEFLQLDNWRAIRTDPVSDRKRGKGFGEIGMCDLLFLRYWASVADVGSAEAQVLWIEFKRKGAQPKPHQSAWHEAERARGALVLVVDDIDSFQEWYFNSGLARKLRAEKGRAV